MERIKHISLICLGILLFCMYSNPAQAAEDITVTTFFPAPAGGVGSSGDAELAQAEDDHVHIGIATHLSGNEYEGKLWVADGSNETDVVVTDTGVVVPDIILQNTDPTNNNYNRLLFVNSFGGVDSAIAGTHEVANGTGATLSGNLQFLTADAAGLATRMTIGQTGNVGIGTSLPSEKLSVAYKTGETTNPTLEISSVIPTSGAYYSPILKLSLSSSIYGLIQYDQNFDNQNLIFRNTSTTYANTNNYNKSSIRFQTGGSNDRMVINSDGNILMGQGGSSDGAKVYINGDLNSGSTINAISSLPSGTTGDYYGFLNSVAGDATNDKFGIKQSVTGTAGETVGAESNVTTTTGRQFGVSNRLTSTSGDQFGSYNYLTTSSGRQWGTYNSVYNSTTSGSEANGVYNNINKNGGIKNGTHNVLAGVGGTQHGTKNNLSGTGNSAQFGVHNSLSNAGTGIKSGVYTIMDNASPGERYGVRNYILNATSGSSYGTYNSVRNASTSTLYGSYNYVRPDGGASAYGVYALASAGTGTKYGVYGEASGGGGTRYGVYGSGQTYGVYGSGSFVGVYGVGPRVGVRAEGTISDFYAAGAGVDYASASSRRWKTNIETMPNALNKVMSLRGVYYDWDEEHGGEHTFGFIAEEVGEVLPEIVTYEQGSPKDAIGLDYSKVSVILVEAIKEQQMMIDKQQAMINELKQEVESLKEQM